MEQNKAILISTKSIATSDKLGIVKPNANHFVIDNTGNLEINPNTIIFDTKYAKSSSLTKLENDLTLLKSDLNTAKSNAVVLNTDQSISGKKSFEKPISIIGTNLNEHIGNLELRCETGVNNFISFTKSGNISADSSVAKIGVSDLNTNIFVFSGSNDINEFNFNKPLKLSIDSTLLIDPKHVVIKEVLTSEVEKLENTNTQIKSQIQVIEDTLKKIEGGTTLIGTIAKTKAEVLADNNLLTQFVQTQESRAPKHGDLVLTSDGYEFKYEDIGGASGKWKDGGKKTVDKATNTSLGVVKGSETEVGKVSVDVNGEMTVNGFNELSNKINSNIESIKLKANQTDLVSLQQEVGKTAKLDQSNNFVAVNNFSDINVNNSFSVKSKAVFEGSDQLFGQISIKKNRTDKAFIDFNDGDLSDNIYGSIGYVEASDVANFTFLSQKGEFLFNKAIKANIENSSISDPKHLITKDLLDTEKRVIEADINRKANDSDVVKLTGDQNVSGIKTFSSILKYSASQNIEHELDIVHKGYVDNKFASISFENYYTKSQVDSELAKKANDSDVVKLSGNQTLTGNNTFTNGIFFKNNMYVSVGGVGDSELQIIPDSDNRTLVFGDGSTKHFNVDFKGKIVKGIATPTENDHATNKKWVEDQIASIPPTDLSQYYTKEQSDTTFAKKSELNSKVDIATFNEVKTSVESNKTELGQISNQLANKVENSEYQTTKQLAKTNEQALTTKANQTDVQSLSEEINKIKGKGLFVRQSTITKEQAIADTSKLTEFVKTNTNPTRDPIIGDQVITSDRYVFIYAQNNDGSNFEWVVEQQFTVSEATNTDLGLVKYGSSIGDVIKGSNGQMSVMGWDSVLLKSGGEVAGSLILTEVSSYKTDVTLTDNKQLANKGYVDQKITDINVASFATKDEVNLKANQSDVVLLNSDQMIGGNKQFNNGITLANGTKIITEGENIKIVPNVNDSYFYFGNTNGNKYFNVDFKNKIVKGLKSPTELDHATNKEYVDNKFNSISFDNYYNKNQIDTELGKKVNNTDLANYSTTDQINNLLQNKANISDVYPKSETYSQTEANNKFALKTALADKANNSDVVKLTEDQSVDGIKTFIKNAKFGENNLIIIPESNGNARFAPLQDNKWLYFSDGINKSWAGIDFNNIKLTRVGLPTASDHVANKEYVDNQISGVVKTSGNQTITGQKLFTELTAFGSEFLVKRSMNGATANYIAFYTDSAKTAEIGFTSGSDNDFVIKNNKADGNISIGSKMLLDPTITIDLPKQLVNKEFVEQQISNLNINNYATSEQLTTGLQQKADSSNVYNKTETYSRTEIDTKESTLEASLEQKANVNDVYNKGQSDSKYALINGDQTLGGNKTFTGITTLLNEQTYKKVTGRSANYFSFYQDNSRTAYLGHGSAANKDFTIATETENGSIVLNPHGNGVINVSNKRITNVALPTSNLDAINKQYFDNAMNSKADTNYVDTQINAKVVNVVSLNTEADINSMPDNTFGFYLRS